MRSMRAKEVEHNYRYVDDMFTLTGSIPSEEEYQLKRKVKRTVDNDGHLVFIGADLWWEEDEVGKIGFSTGVHFREGSYPITIKRYPVRESVILDTQRCADSTICAGHQTLVHSEEVQRGWTKGHGISIEERLQHEGTEMNVDQVPEAMVRGTGGGHG